MWSISYEQQKNIKMSTTTNPKIRMQFEIIAVMNFLGLSVDRFPYYFKKYGGLVGLHDEMSHRLGVK